MVINSVHTGEVTFSHPAREGKNPSFPSPPHQTCWNYVCDRVLSITILRVLYEMETFKD